MADLTERTDAFMHNPRAPSDRILVRDLRNALLDAEADLRLARRGLTEIASIARGSEGFEADSCSRIQRIANSMIELTRDRP